MKTEDYKNRIEELQKIKQDNLEKFINPITKQILDLEDKVYKNIFLNKEYITDLSEYNGKKIIFTAINSKGQDVWLPTDEIVSVKNGKLYLSSHERGIVYFDNKKQKYIKVYFGLERELDVIGFIDVKIID